MTFLAILATVFGMLAGMANFPQVLKIFKRKSAKDISILTYSFLLIGAVVWIFYGIEIKSFAVFITNVFGVFSIGSVVIGWFLYGREKKK